MGDYFVCFDGVNGYEESFILAADNDDLEEQVSDVLFQLGGGHADVFDEFDNFMYDVEV